MSRFRAFWVTLMALNLLNFNFHFKKRLKYVTHIIVASIDVLLSLLAHPPSSLHHCFLPNIIYAVLSRHFFCCNLRTFSGKIFLAKTMFV